MPDDKNDLGKPKIGVLSSAVKQYLDACHRPAIRMPTDTTALTSLTKSLSPMTTVQAEMHKQKLLQTEIHRQRQMQAAMPKTELASMKFTDELRKLNAPLAVPRAVAEITRMTRPATAMFTAIEPYRKIFEVDTTATATLAATSSTNMIKMAIPQPPLFAAWKEQQALWEKQQAFLHGFKKIGASHIIEAFSESEPVTIIRGIVDWLRGDKETGNELEKKVADNLPDLLHKQLDIEVLKTDRNLHLNRGGQNGEIDFVVYCEGNVIFLVEVKKTIDKKKINHFINNNVRIFIDSKDTPNDGKIHGVIAYANSRGDAISFAKEQGLLICRITESGLVLVDPPHLQQLCDLRSTNFDKPETLQKHRKKKLNAPNIPHEWITYSKNGDGTIPAFKVRDHPTRLCNNYMKKFIDRYDLRRYFLHHRFIAEAIAGDYIVPLEKFVTDVLLGWKNIIVFDDETIPFSAENATKLFVDLPDLYDDLVLRTYKLWHNKLTNETVQ